MRRSVDYRARLRKRFILTQEIGGRTFRLDGYDTRAEADAARHARTEDGPLKVPGRLFVRDTKYDLTDRKIKQAKITVNPGAPMGKRIIIEPK